jgi:hypothetical protein
MKSYPLTNPKAQGGRGLEYNSTLS